MKKNNCILIIGAFLMVLGFTIPLFAEPLQDNLFVILKPNGVMGKSPLYPTLTVADSSDAWGKKLYDTIKNDPQTREVLLRYQRSQTETMDRYKKQLAAEGKSSAEIEKLAAGKATPMYFVLRDGKGTPLMESGSAFIQTYKNGKLETDFQYVCPKVKVTKEWEGFSKDQSKPFSDSEKKDFLNLVCHETSHGIMKETYGYIPKSVNPLVAFGHWEGKQSSSQLAMTEGYAEFMGAWFSGSDDYSQAKFTKDMDTNIPRTPDENKKTEGVIACTFWDIAKGDSGIKNGMEKIHQVLRENHPWTLDGFTKGFKELFPADAGALDNILKQNLVPETETLITCWFNLNSERARIANMEKAYANISALKNPIQKAKAWWKLYKARSDYKKMVSRYQSIYGYTLEQLTSAKPPIKKKTPAPPVAQADNAVKAATQKATVTSGGPTPFSE